MSPSTERLFTALDATWPAAKVLRQGPWTLRQGLGGGQRVSAATAELTVTQNDIAEAEAGMAALGQTPLFMIRENEGALDRWLAARGYDIVDPVTMYLAPTSDLTGEIRLSAAIPAWPPLALQVELWDKAGIGPARMAVMERAKGAKTSILGRTGETPCGTVFVAADGDISMLHALEVTSVTRRSGVGRTLLTACANWAASAGAPWMALAVTTANGPANALYRAAGMTPVATYHYRRAPSGPS